MVTHYEVILWHNIIGRLLKLSLQSGIRPSNYSWDLDMNLPRTRGNSAVNQRLHIVPEKSDVQASLIVILADVIQSGMSTCPNNLQSTYQLRMSDFRDIIEFRASVAVWFEFLSVGRAHLEARGRNFKLQLQTFFSESNLCKTPIEVSKVAGG